MAQKLHSFGADSNMLKHLKATSLLHFSLWYITQQALHTHAKPAKISRLQRLWSLCCTRPQEEYGPQKNHCPSELKQGGKEGSKDPPYFPCSIACGTFIPCHCIRREIAPQGRQQWQYLFFNCSSFTGRTTEDIIQYQSATTILSKS